MAESTYQSSSSTDTRTNRESIKKGFDDFKRFASTNFTRAVQYVSEKTGKAGSVTEYDEEYTTLCHQLDLIKTATEKMVGYVEAIVEPNPNVRFETWARTKIDKPKPDPPGGHALLSGEMGRVANTFGTETQYGAYLIRCSEVESKLAESQRRFKETTLSDYVIPLKAFLEVDIKAVLRERKAVSVLRLDLDAALTKAKKAQGDKLVLAEDELASIQGDYDAQLGKTRVSLRRIVDTHVNHMGYMRKFMAAQRAYFSECQSHLEDIEGSYSSPSPRPQLSASSDSSGKFSLGGVELDRDEAYKGRMLYDYEAQSEGELTINAGEVLVVYPIPGDDDYIMGEYRGSSGKILATYIEKL